MALGFPQHRSNSCLITNTFRKSLRLLLVQLPFSIGRLCLNHSSAVGLRITIAQSIDSCKRLVHGLVSKDAIISHKTCSTTLLRSGPSAAAQWRDGQGIPWALSWGQIEMKGFDALHTDCRKSMEKCWLWQGEVIRWQHEIG